MSVGPGNAVRLGATKLVGDSFRLLFANFGVLYPMALVPVLLIAAAQIAVEPPDATSTGQVAISGGFLALALVNLLVSYVAAAALCLATVDCVAGTRRSLNAYVRRAAAYAVPLFVLGIVLSIAVSVALLFLIVPGLYVLAQFLVWVPAVVIEGQGMGGLGRAQALTRGHRWPLVGALIVLFLFSVAAFIALLPFFGMAAAGAGTLIAVLAAALAEAFVYAVFSIFVALVYLRLREIKEGVVAADLVHRETDTPG